MGWSDAVDDVLRDLAGKVDWLLAHHARLLVGRPVRVANVRVPDPHWGGHRYVDGVGTVTAAEGGVLVVALPVDGQTVEVRVSVHGAEVVG